MDLTQFQDFNIKNPASVREFLDLNALNHQAVHNSLLSAGIVIEQYPMFSDTITATWQDVHYKEHLAWANALSLPVPPDLNNVDWGDESQVSDWKNNHSAAHSLIAQALGL